MFLEEENHVIEFQKYARLLTEKFDVTIEFDGAEAKTDGNVISLPNVYGMTEGEVEFLYCIVLHEIGHVRHTSFDESLFSQVKSHNHFGIINSIEDARIENKMMQDFDGAESIFHDLYNVYSNDPAYMKKVFKADTTKQTTLWFNFCILVHNYLLNIEADSSEFEKGQNGIEAKKMFGQVLDKLDNAVLASTKDVFKLGTELYDLFFDEGADKSEKVDGAESMKSRDEAKKAIADLKKQLDDLMKKHKDVRAENSKLRKQKKVIEEARSEFYEKNKDVLDKADKNFDQANDQLNTINDYTNAKNEADHENAKVQKKQAQMSREAQVLNRMKQKIEELKERLANAGTDEQEKKIQEMLDKKEERENKLNNKIRNTQRSLDRSKNYEKWAKEEMENLKEEMEKLKDVDPNKLKQQIKDAQHTSSPIRKEMHDKFDKKINDLKQEIKDNNSQMRQEKKQHASQSTQDLADINELMQKAGMGQEGGVLPQFDENGDWKEGDAVQKQFDQDASNSTGQPVQNGMSPFGSSVRDIVAHLEQVTDNLANIDVAKLFNERHGVNRLEQFNDTEADVNNTRDVDNDKTFTSTKRHIPLTTQFDVVREETTGGNVIEINEIKKEKANEIARLTSVFKSKFHFKSKHKFRGNKEEGTLDPRDVYKIPKGLSRQIFEQVEKKFENKVNVTVAIDISGSMDKDLTEYGRKLRELAVGFDEALTACHVKHEIIGYGAPVCSEMDETKASPVYNRTKNNLETIVYRNQKGASALQNIEPQCIDNVDGESLKVIGKRMLKTRSKKKVLFIVTDGKPFTADADLGVLDQDLRNTIKWLRANKIEVFAFGYDEQARDFYGDKFFKIEDENYDQFLRFFKDQLSVVR